MSNNISRKGLAWGALVAIVGSLFASAPAHAAGGLNLAANSTSQVLAVPSGSSFQLIATATSDIPESSYKTLAVQVDNTDAGTATVTVDGRFVKSMTTVDSRVVFTSDLRDVLTNNQTIEVRGSDSTSKKFTVTAWLDANANGVLDKDAQGNPTEYSSVKEVWFYAADKLTATTEFVKAPTYTNDARKSLDVRVSLTNVNLDQLKLTDNFSTGNSVVVSNLSVDLRAGTYDARFASADLRGAKTFVSGDGRFYAGDGSPATVMGVTVSTQDSHVWTAGAVFTAQAFWGTDAISAKVSTVGGLINNSATDILLGTVKGSNATLADATTHSASVRTSSAFQLSATVRADSSAALAGQSVVFGVTSGSAQWSTASIRVTVSGVGVTSTEYSTSKSFRDATWTVKTDANGNALLNVSISGMKANDPALNNIEFTAKSGNKNAVSVIVQQTDAVATTLTATPDNQAVELSKAATVVATLKDQFGELVNSGYVAQAVRTGGVGSADSNTYATIVNGKATLAITVDGSVTGATRYDIKAAKVDSTNGSTGTAFSPYQITIATRSAADLAANYIKIGLSTETLGVRTAAARVSVDAKALAGAKASAFTAVAQSISGRVVITGERGTAYAVVALKGAGLYFVNADGGFDAGATTVIADIDGFFTATVRSNVSGTASVTVTAGSAAAQSISWTVDAPSAENGWYIVRENDATQTLLVGKDATVTFSVRDTFDNRVKNTYGSTSADATLFVRVSGDVTREAYGVDENGYITVKLNPGAGTTGTVYFTSYFSSSVRGLVTSQARVDWAKETVTVDAPEAATAGQNVDVVVTVLDPAGDPIKNYEITATSTGVGNLTVAKATTDVNGQAYLKLFAAAGELGWAYVTATSTTGSVVADVAGIQFQAAPTATDNVATLALAVPATAQAGTVVDVVATATDADGNAVQGAVVSATSTGVGYLAVAGGTTDADGKVTLKLVVTAGENGTASVTAAAGDVTSEAASVTAGVTDANITLAKKRVTVDWSFAANKKVVIVRDGVVIKSFTASSNAADSFSFNLKNGTRKVSVKVGGVTLDSQTYKIK